MSGLAEHHSCTLHGFCLAILIYILIIQYATAGITLPPTSVFNSTEDVTERSESNNQKHNERQQVTSANAGNYEIRVVSGEPNYKSVNLTWEVEFVPTTNQTDALLPPKSFQIFYCEMQSFGPHRCRSKTVEDNGKSSEPIRHYTARIDNLRMATKYSFHIKPQQKRRSTRISGRSEIMDNEVENDAFQGQTIVIPTKGFSAQATKCLPHASEIEVETGPHFGGKIVVDGGNCGIKGNPKEETDKYVMRIDHKKCGSLVKPETNTVETFITVQENLGIFTHSTRRFVVVCSFQSGMQTVRASFTVPGKGGVAAPVENDPFEPDRVSREHRQLNFVDKSGLILKDDDTEDTTEPVVATRPSVAIIEDIIPGINEVDIKHEPRERPEEPAVPQVIAAQTPPVKHYRQAKFAKLIHEPEDDRGMFQARAYGGDLKDFAGNAGSVVLTVSLSVIMIGVFVYVLFRESRRQTFSRRNLQQLPKGTRSSNEPAV